MGKSEYYLEFQIEKGIRLESTLGALDMVLQWMLKTEKHRESAELMLGFVDDLKTQIPDIFGSFP